MTIASKILIRHLGLGDGIILVGAAVELSQQHGPIWFPCWKRDEQSFETIFASVPEVMVMPVETETEMLKRFPSSEHILTGHYAGYPSEGKSLDTWFYDQLGMPLTYKWTKFPWEQPTDYSWLQQQLPYAFIHEAEERGFPIDLASLLKRWRPMGENRPNGIVFTKPWMPSITDFADPIYHAAELDLINSAFLHFADILDLRPDQPKYLHRYARPWNPIDMPQLQYDWIILD